MVRVLILLVILWSSACYRTQELCDVCQRQIHAEASYRVTLRDGTTKRLCCPRCGLHFQKGIEVAGAAVSDYATGKLIRADDAYFVESSTVIVCCSTPAIQRDQTGTQYRRNWDRCLPSLVAFEHLGDAEGFAKRKGGILKTFSELLQEPE